MKKNRLIMRYTRKNKGFFDFLLHSTLVILLLCTSLMYSQNREVQGTILDENGLPLPGASVLEKGTTNGAITDFDGNYSLVLINENSILIISYIGYVIQEIKTNGLTNIKINLEVDTATLDEVVIIGYGSLKKSDVTGAVSSFDTKTLEQQPQTNILQALQGNIAGISVNTSGSSAEDGGALLVRGQNSISASNEPLIVLDGIPYDGSLSQISPSDIKNLEVLKDASSTAIYGSRGANGVILITTKKGIKGKPKFSYTGFTTIDQPGSLPDMQNAAEHWGSNWERVITNRLEVPSNNIGVSQAIDSFFPGDETNNTELAAFMTGYPGQTWRQVKNNILSNYPALINDRPTLLKLAQDFTYPNGGRDTDWLKLATRVGTKQEHNFSISGGTEDIKYFISTNYNKSDGIAIGDTYKRNIFRANFSAKLFKGVEYGTNTQFGFFNRSGIPAEWNGGQGAFRINPLFNALNEDGSIDLTPNNNDFGVTNPLEPLLFNNEDKQKTINTNHYLSVDIPGVEGLNYRLNLGYRFSDSAQKTYKGFNTVQGAQDNGNLAIINSVGNSYTLENILSYKRDFGKHSIFLTGLYSAQKSVDEEFGINGRGFPNDVRTFYQADNAGILESFSEYVQKNYNSQMFRANYVFDSRYLITGTVRRDGYSAFGKDKKYGVFPSLALGWNIANENFMQSIDNIKTLKLRLSYGQSGNEAVRPYSKLANLTASNYIDQNQNILFGYRPSRLSNPNLSWETTSSFNLGLDFTLYNGRISGTLDAFSSETSDLLLEESISAVNGTNQILRNVGETKNKGLEVTLTTVNVRNDSFSWKTNFVGSLYRTEIVQVGLKDANGKWIDDIASGWFIGQPVNVNFDYTLDRILQKQDFVLDALGNYVLDGNNDYQLLPEVANGIIDLSNSQTPRPGQPIVKDTNGNGIIDPNDREIQGNENPDFTAGLTNTFTYKNFTFSFFVNGIWGVTKFNKFINNNGFTNSRKLDINYWTPENPANELPGLNMNSLTSGVDLNAYQDASYIRIQDVTLSYKLPTSLTDQLSMENLEVFSNLKNLYTFTDWEGLDPDYDANGTDIPRPFSITLGLRLTF